MLCEEGETPTRFTPRASFPALENLTLHGSHSFAGIERFRFPAITI